MRYYIKCDTYNQHCPYAGIIKREFLLRAENAGDAYAKVARILSDEGLSLLNYTAGADLNTFDRDDLTEQEALEAEAERDDICEEEREPVEADITLLTKFNMGQVVFVLATADEALAFMGYINDRTCIGFLPSYDRVRETFVKYASGIDSYVFLVNDGHLIWTLRSEYDGDKTLMFPMAFDCEKRRLVKRSWT